MNIVLDMNGSSHEHVRMKLAEYLRLKGMSDTDFAERIGKDRSLVTRYKSGGVTPSLGVIVRIEAETEGAVTASDFLEAPPERAAQ